VGDFKTSLSPIDKSSRQNIKVEASELSDTTVQMDLTQRHKVIEYFTQQQHNTLSSKQPMEFSPK
jgi:hypothetical protein